DRQHVIGVFERLAVRTNDAVLHAGADVTQVFVAGGAGASGHGRHAIDHPPGLRRFTGAQVFDIDHAQRGEFDIQGNFAPALADRDLAAAAHHPADVEGLAGGTAQGVTGEFQRTAPIVETGLIHRDAAITQRLVDLDVAFEGFARFVVGDFHHTAETAGHAGGIVFHHEVFQTEVE